MKSNILTLTVSQLNEYLKAMLDSCDNLSDIYIKGEISNFTNHIKSGHFYFSLKDNTSLLKAVMFRTYAEKIDFMPENGMKVIVRGQISVFPRDGVYQLYAREIIPDGIGSLYLAFEQLKQRLLEKGLFDEEHKKEIPQYPQKIGIITAPDAAAVADMKNIITRRYPIAEIIVYPSLVQGSGAPRELISGLQYFNTAEKVDTIIIGRGGGSAEDLWAFNSEELAYAVYASEIPVISAVGHETDFTICDFVADKRAPTPSAAAELCVPDIAETVDTLLHYRNFLSAVMTGKTEKMRLKLETYKNNEFFKSPYTYTDSVKERLTGLYNDITSGILEHTEKKRHALSERSAKLEALSPLSVLSRGFSVVYDTQGRIVSDRNAVKSGDEVSIRFKSGKAYANITKTED